MSQAAMTSRALFWVSRGSGRIPGALARNSRANASLLHRQLHASPRHAAIKPFILADIGEGIREVEIIQWFVQPGAAVEEWDKLCEVQSDKASVEITSRFAGIVRKLHYDAGEVAGVGKPLVDIDVPDEHGAWGSSSSGGSGANEDKLDRDIHVIAEGGVARKDPDPSFHDVEAAPKTPGEARLPQSSTSSKMLATPAVRHLVKEHSLRVEDIKGTGRDGRVLKEDILRLIKERSQTSREALSSRASGTGEQAMAMPQQNTPTELTTTQLQMFKTMTRSLSIPHFTYADEIDFTSLAALRTRLNLESSKDRAQEAVHLTYLPFIIKAVSAALKQFPILNARIDAETSPTKPRLIMRSQHNIGIAMDTPLGLLVPVIKHVQMLTIPDIAREISRLQELGAASRLAPVDLSGGTITVSNIGVIGGTYTAPVIVDREVAILGIGKVRTVPGFDDAGAVVAKRVVGFSWCADHRVVDGATMARAGEVVRLLIEAPERMLLSLR